MEDDNADSALKPDEESRIRRLPESVINRIAAGEVVVRPSAALKELLENSLDAGASSITVTVRQGGLKLLQVTDDGKGISIDDLPLLCQRFATSKLRTFEDLAIVSTFGFRGEALASISHVSRLSVLTKTKDSDVAYKAAFLDGILRGDPEPTAGCQGTTMIIEDMFYNIVSRRNALKSPSDEYRAVVDVVSRYAIRYPEVAFICRRSQAGSSSRAVSAADVRTELCSSVKDNVRAGFGPSVANELLSFDIDIPRTKAKVSAHVTSANFSMKKAIFILFINGRLVECQPFKRAVSAAYACFLPKSGHPFVYIDLSMNQADIDVNVHPTKKEVRFLNDQAIVEAVVERLIARLKTTETSRTFLAQSIIAADGSKLRAELPPSQEAPTEPNHLIADEDENQDPVELDVSAEEIEKDGGVTNHVPVDDNDGNSTQQNPPLEMSDSLETQVVDVDAPARLSLSLNDLTEENRKVSSARVTDGSNGRPSSKSKAVYAKDKVRTGSNAPVGLYDVYLNRTDQSSSAVAIQAWRKRSSESLPLLTSVEGMLDKCRKNAHRGLSEVLNEHVYIGAASDKFVLFQHSTTLMLAEIGPVLVELMYQQSLMRFADHETFRLDPPAPVTRLLEAYTKTLEQGETRTSVETCATILLEKGPMLSEYYGVSFLGQEAENVEIEALPLLFPDVMPDMKYFGAFLYHLAVDTNWTDEGSCLQGVAMAIANWYGRHWIPAPVEDANESMEVGDENHDANSDDGYPTPSPDSKKSSQSEEGRRQWLLRHILFASLRKDFYPPQRFYNEKVIREITSTAKLYKVFERC